MRHVDDGTMHAWLDRQVSDPVDVARIGEHLRECAACAARLEEERTALEQAEGLLSSVAPAADASRAAFEALVERADRLAASSQVPPVRLHSWTFAAGWAASVALAVALGWAARDLWSGGNDHPVQMAAGQQPAASDPVSSSAQVPPPAAPPRLATSANSVSRDSQDSGGRTSEGVAAAEKKSLASGELQGRVDSTPPANTRANQGALSQGQGLGLGLGQGQGQVSPSPPPPPENATEVAFTLNARLREEKAAQGPPPPEPAPPPAAVASPPAAPAQLAAPPATVALPQAASAEAARVGEAEAVTARAPAPPPAAPGGARAGGGAAGGAAGGRGGGGRGGGGGGGGGRGAARGAGADGLLVSAAPAQWRTVPRTDAAARSGMALYGIDGLMPSATMLSADGAAVRTVYQLASGETVEITQQKAADQTDRMNNAPASVAAATASTADAQNARQQRSETVASTPPAAWTEVRGDVRLTLRGAANPEALVQRLRLD